MILVYLSPLSSLDFFNHRCHQFCWLRRQVEYSPKWLKEQEALVDKALQSHDGGWKTETMVTMVVGFQLQEVDGTEGTELQWKHDEACILY